MPIQSTNEHIQHTNVPIRPTKIDHPIPTKCAYIRPTKIAHPTFIMCPSDQQKLPFRPTKIAQPTYNVPIRPTMCPSDIQMCLSSLQKGGI